MKINNIFKNVNIKSLITTKNIIIMLIIIIIIFLVIFLPIYFVVNNSSSNSIISSSSPIAIPSTIPSTIHSTIANMQKSSIILIQNQNQIPMTTPINTRSIANIIL